MAEEIGTGSSNRPPTLLDEGSSRLAFGRPDSDKPSLSCDDCGQDVQVGPQDYREGSRPELVS